MADGVLGSAKQEQLQARMALLGINEADLLEKFVQGSGSGGQKINKTSSCVYLKHLPSGRDVKCQKTRSLSLNRYYARVELCEQIEEEVLGEKSKRQQEIEKIRRQSVAVLVNSVQRCLMTSISMQRRKKTGNL